MSIDWKQRARSLFNFPKPTHFTNHTHCCECAEHDEVLLSDDIDSISLAELGNPGWDPLCFSSPEGMLYYMPALVRLTLDTIEKPIESYLDQFVFHLIKDGPGNNVVSACTEEQRQFVADFSEYLITNHAVHIDDGTFLADDLLRAHEIWTNDG